MRRLASFLAKAVISALLLYLSLRRVDLAGIEHRFAELNWAWAPAMLSALSVQTLLLAYRWREISATCNARLNFTAAIRYSFIGLFFSQVLPSTVGGDAARIWLLARNGTGWPTASYSVLIDRVVGVTVLAVLVVACLPWTLELVHNPTARAALALIGFGTLAATITFAALSMVPPRIMGKMWLTRHLAVASGLMWRLCRSPGVGTRITALSVAIQLVTVIVAWNAARAAHAGVGFSQLALLVLPVTLIATIPISIAGWGVRESAMVLAFSYAGLAASDGLIVSIMLGAATFATGIIGGIIWIASGYQWRAIDPA